VLSGALVPLLRGLEAANPDAGDADGVRSLSLAMVYAGALLFAAPRAGRVARAAARQPLVFALVLLALLSAAWSGQPEVTLRRALALGGTTLFGIYLAARFSARELLSLLAAALAVAAILSAAFVVAVPQLGISSAIHEGAWRGVFVHKNGLGHTMALGAFTFVVAGLGSAGLARVAWLAAAVGAAVLVIGSESTTALALLVVMLPLLGALQLLRWRHRLLAPLLLSILLGAAVAVALVAARASDVLALAGRDGTFTGRTELWTGLWGLLEGRTVQGFGYGAFWRGTAESQTVFGAVGWEPWHAHNGFLDLLLHLGAIGLVLFALAYLGAARSGVSRFRASWRVSDLWPLAFLAFLALSNLTESSLLQHHGLYWALFVAAACLSPDGETQPAGRRGASIRPRGVSLGVRRFLHRMPPTPR
jgi:exopolysaccharide production protein ExoQ